MPFRPVPVRVTLQHDHAVRTVGGESLVFAAGETLAGAATVWRRKGPPETNETAARPDMPDYFAFELHFLRDGQI